MCVCVCSLLRRGTWPSPSGQALRADGWPLLLESSAQRTSKADARGATVRLLLLVESSAHEHHMCESGARRPPVGVGGRCGSSRPSGQRGPVSLHTEREGERTHITWPWRPLAVG